MAVGGHFGERRLRRRPAGRRQRRFDGAKASTELRIGGRHGSVRIDAEVAREIDHGEEKIADLLGFGLLL